jgi:hypothetical protein
MSLCTRHVAATAPGINVRIVAVAPTGDRVPSAVGADDAGGDRRTMT